MLKEDTDSSDLERVTGIVREHLATTHPSVQLGPARMTYLRHKPAVSTLVGFELELSDRAQHLIQHYTATTYADREEADRALAKWSTRRPLPVPFGEPIFCSASGSTLLCAFPNDAALSGLKIAVDPAKLRHVLDQALLPAGERTRAKTLEIERVTYKPERRFVARLVVGSRVAATQARAWRTVYLRVYADETGEVCRAVSELLADQFDFVPRPLGHDLETRIYFQEERAGPSLIDLLLDKRAETVTRDAGRKLRRIHVSGLELSRRIGPQELVGRLERTSADLCSLDPELGALAGCLVTRLRSDTPACTTDGPVHGDFHQGQIVATDRGAVLLDFDEAGWGAPELDLGNFLAHLEVLERFSSFTKLQLDRVRKSLLDGYSADLPDLSWYRSAALVLLAARPFREQAADWRSRTAVLLRAADECLA